MRAPKVLIASLPSFTRISRSKQLRESLSPIFGPRLAPLLPSPLLPFEFGHLISVWLIKSSVSKQGSVNEPRQALRFLAWKSAVVLDDRCAFEVGLIKWSSDRVLIDSHTFRRL